MLILGSTKFYVELVAEVNRLIVIYISNRALYHPLHLTPHRIDMQHQELLNNYVRFQQAIGCNRLKSITRRYI